MFLTPERLADIETALEASARVDSELVSDLLTAYEEALLALEELRLKPREPPTGMCGLCPLQVARERWTIVGFLRERGHHFMKLQYLSATDAQRALYLAAGDIAQNLHGGLAID